MSDLESKHPVMVRVPADQFQIIKREAKALGVKPGVYCLIKIMEMLNLKKAA